MQTYEEQLAIAKMWLFGVEVEQRDTEDIKQLWHSCMTKIRAETLQDPIEASYMLQVLNGTHLKTKTIRIRPDD